MIRKANQLTKKDIYIVAIVWLISCTSSADASPAAYPRNDLSMFMKSDMIVEVVVTKSRRWSEGSTTLHLVAKYKVVDVFKGDVDKDDILIVTDTCLDESVPERMVGYPAVERYCRGLIGLHLTGVDSRDGKPVMKSGKNQDGFCFLGKI